MARNLSNYVTADHEPAYENFVGDFSRHCPMCEKDMPLDRFKHHGGIKYDVMCIPCAGKDKVAGSEIAKAGAVDALAKALSKSTGRKMMAEACPAGVTGVKAIMQELGGEGETWKFVAAAVKSGLTAEKPDVQVKAANTIINMVTTVEKNQGDPLDISHLSDEDRIEILFEPAKQLLLESQEFRRVLINDPIVRAALLHEAGIDVIEHDKV